MGVLLVITGLLFLTGQFTRLSYWFLETFPMLQTLRLSQPRLNPVSGISRDKPRCRARMSPRRVADCGGASIGDADGCKARR